MCGIYVIETFIWPRNYCTNVQPPPRKIRANISAQNTHRQHITRGG